MTLIDIELSSRRIAIQKHSNTDPPINTPEMPTRLSQSTSLRLSASVFGTIFVAFGINAILRPVSGLSFFPYEPPAPSTSEYTKQLVDDLMKIYGVRDVFMGVAIWAAAYYGERRALGWIMLAGSSVAFADGAIVGASVPGGEWNHWSYAPILTVVGLTLLGLFDRA